MHLSQCQSVAVCSSLWHTMTSTVLNSSLMPFLFHVYVAQLSIIWSSGISPDSDRVRFCCLVSWPSNHKLAKILYWPSNHIKTGKNIILTKQSHNRLVKNIILTKKSHNKLVKNIILTKQSHKNWQNYQAITNWQNYYTDQAIT